MGGGPITLEVVDRLETLTDEWHELADRVRARPFVYPGWIEAWRRAFGRGPARAFTARRSEHLVGLLALEKRMGVLRSPTNAHSPEFAVLAEDQEASAALSAALFAHGATAVRLGHLDADASGLAVLRDAGRTAGYRAVEQVVASSPYIRGRSSLQEHERSLSRNLRHDADRRLRRLQETGAVSVQVCDGREGLDELLAEGFRVERLGWKGARGTAIASRPQTRGFYTDVARWAASLGWLRLAFLRVDDQPIAFQLDLEAHRIYYSLKIGYDPAYERFSPGKLLAYAMVSRAVSTGLESYELLGTDEPWKHRWSKTLRQRVALYGFAPSPAGYLAWSAFVHGRSLARRVPFASRAAAAFRR